MIDVPITLSNWIVDHKIFKFCCKKIKAIFLIQLPFDSEVENAKPIFEVFEVLLRLWLLKVFQYFHFTSLVDFLVCSDWFPPVFFIKVKLFFHFILLFLLDHYNFSRNTNTNKITHFPFKELTSWRHWLRNPFKAHFFYYTHSFPIHWKIFNNKFFLNYFPLSQMDLKGCIQALLLKATRKGFLFRM